MVEFTETFEIKKVTTTDWAAYRQFIESLRIKTPLIFRRTRNNIPILHPEVDPPTGDKWFDIILKTTVKTSPVEIKLRIRRSNLYLDGYQTANKWFEFGVNNPRAVHLIPGSTFLGFGGDYTSLQRYARQNRETIKLGWKQLQEAVEILATATSSDQQKAKALMVVIQMICESSRFKKISKHLSEKFQDDTGKDKKAEVPPLWMVELETSWGEISDELLHTDSDPNHPFKSPNPNTDIKNAPEAWAAIGMLKYFKYPRTM